MTTLTLYEGEAHRLVFVAPEAAICGEDADANVIARCILSTELLRSLLEIIPRYLELCEKGEEPEAPIQYSDRVIQFRPRRAAS
jgi:hypothetical protein